MRKIRVGVSVQINDKNDSFWVNGIKQNAVTIVDTLSLCPNVETCKIVNLGTLKDYNGTAWEPFKENIINFDEFIDNFDVFVSITVSPSLEMIEKMREKNIKYVKHVMGNEYQIFSEYVVFDVEKTSNSWNKRVGVDRVWISPHIYDQNKDFLEVVTEAPAYIGPYVWSHKFIDEHVRLFKEKNGGTGLYQPRKESTRRISTFEPNINLIKTCVTPVIIGEKMFLKEPELIDVFNIFGSSKIKEKKSFVEFASTLKIYKEKKMFFESRYPIVWSLFEHTDIMLCHQRDLPLNYAYFDAAWLGFPVVHNAEMVKDLGYYYDLWDADTAVEHLIDICKNFDSQKDEYLKKSREVISRYLPDHPDNVNGYAELLEECLS